MSFERKVEGGWSYMRKRSIILGILMTSGRKFKGVISIMIPMRVTILNFYGCESNWFLLISLMFHLQSYLGLGKLLGFTSWALPLELSQSSPLAPHNIIIDKSGFATNFFFFFISIWEFNLRCLLYDDFFYHQTMTPI